MSTAPDRDYIDARLLAATDQMAGNMKALIAFIDGRLSSLETDVATIKADVAVIRSNYATSTDLATAIGAVRADIARLESTILKWFFAAVMTMMGLALATANLIH